MKVIAKTNEGVLIEATNSEIHAILAAVNGASPKEIAVNQKIPAIDYAATIKDIKGLKSDYGYTELLKYAKRFNRELENLSEVVENASKI